ncbi:hypothetical protein RQP46_004745 [Phenoliferia psychrophenolica]
MSKRPHPTLPKLAFAPPTALPARRTMPRSIIDTHIHLFTSDQISANHITWPAEKAAHDPLHQPHELAFYQSVTERAASSGLLVSPLEGFVFVQAEVKHDDSDSTGAKGGWDSAVDEVDAVCKAALAGPTPALLGLVPWAPVHKGPEALKAFIARLEALPSLLALSLRASTLSGESAVKARPIKGFRYLLQDSPAGFSLSEDFIAGLKWIGEQGYTFDLTVDAGPLLQGPIVLEEAIECISRVQSEQEEGKQTKFILDHFAKPDLVSEPTFPLKDDHTSYIRSMFSLSLLPNVYIKLSGLLDSAAPELVAEAFAEYLEGAAKAGAGHARTGSLSGIPVAVAGEGASQESASGSSMSLLKRRVLTFLAPVLEAFGDSKLVVGSDWPMFRAKTVKSTSIETRDINEEAAAWAFEIQLYRLCFLDLGLDGEALDRVFAENAKEFYSLP